MWQYMLAYKNAVDVTYSHTEQITTLVEAAGKRWNIYSLTLYAPKLSLQKWECVSKSAVKATVRTFVLVNQLLLQEKKTCHDRSCCLC